MILICPTAFKGTLSATAAASAMADGARTGLTTAGLMGTGLPASSLPGTSLLVRPLSDGGNGLLDALEAADGGRGRGERVAGPLGTSVTARILIQDDRVVVETAEACGLHLVPEPLRDPLRADTRGVGELLLAAAGDVPDGGGLVVGLGGSATVDAGAGMLTALGWRLLDDDGRPIPAGGEGLLDLARVEPPAGSQLLPPLTVLADVTNPLLGAGGAARVYGPQKGASEAQVDRLERGLERWVRVVRRDLGRDVADLPGAGAAGGLGAAFACLGADPRSGADWVLDAVGFDAALADAAAVVTGEGRWDGQSSMGKVTGEVVARCRAAGVPVLLVVGGIDGPGPDGVTVATGGEERLDAASLARLVAEALPGLLPGRGDP